MDTVLQALATWRLTHILFGERGPFNVFVYVRSLTGVVHDEDGEVIGRPFGSVFSCILCLSVWTGLGVQFLPKWLVRTLALSGATIFLGKLWSLGEGEEDG